MDSLEIILERASKTYSEEEKLAMATEKNENYRNSLNELSKNNLSEDAISTLNEIKSRGYKIAIASSSKNTDLILNNIGLGTFFDAVTNGNDITHSKPHPEVFLKAAKKLNLKPEECLVIEDATAGIDAGFAGNFKTCGIGDASKYKKTDYPISCLRDILKYID